MCFLFVCLFCSVFFNGEGEFVRLIEGFSCLQVAVNPDSKLD